MIPEKLVEFNVNDYVWVRLTDAGRSLHRKRHDDLIEMFPRTAGSLRYTPPAEDAEGWSKWQMWSFMETFGGEHSGLTTHNYATAIRFHATDMHPVVQLDEDITTLRLLAARQSANDTQAALRRCIARLEQL